MLINASDQGDQSWLGALSRLDLAILDIYYPHAQQAEFVSRRRQSFKGSRQMVFTQIALPKPLPGGKHLKHRIAKRTRGWLDRHISGMEAKKIFSRKR